jgi:tetratricopeptide (TPR) repeat protein/DNA-binding CsgD family transcriptional regulator
MRIALIIFSISLSIMVYPQGRKVDSLETILKSAQNENRVNVLNELATTFVRNDTARAMVYLREAMVLSEKIDYCLGRAKGIRIKAMAFYFSNHHKKSIELMEESAALAYDCKLWELVCDNYNGIAATYLSLWQNYNLSLEYYFKSKKTYEEHLPNGRISLPLLGIANVYRQQGDFEKSLEYYQKATPLIQQSNDEEAISLLYENLGELYVIQKKFDLAKQYYQKSLALFEKGKKPGGMIFSCVGLANISREQKDFTNALRYGEKALALSDSFKTYERAKLYGCESLGKTYLALNDYPKAKVFFLRVEAVATKLHMIEELRTSYESLAIIAEKTGDYKNAFAYQRLHTAYSDSVMNKTKARQISQLEVQLESEKKKKEIEILERDKQLSQFTVAAAIAAMLGLVVFMFMIVSGQKMKHKKDRELSEMQKQILEERSTVVEAELENKKLAEEKLKQELEFKTRELTTSALNLIQKNEALENLKKSIEEIRKLPEDQLKGKLHSIINTVNYSFSLDKDWDSFRVHFEQVHKGFFEKLLHNFPDLTPNDLKICALMRLQLQTKEMASILDISPESAKVARHRLRKKLKLANDQNLTSFLASY